MSSATGVDRASDKAALRALFTRMCEAWTAGDADAYGACFTSDCSYVSFDGARATSRDAVVASHDALFRGVLFGSALVGQVEGVQLLRPDAALVHGTGSVQVAWRSQLPRKRATRSTIVAVRHPAAPEGWLFAAIQNTRIRPQTVPGPDTFLARTARRLVALAAQAGLGHAREVRATR